MLRIFRSVSACKHFRCNFLTQNQWNTINLRPTFATFSNNVNNAHDEFGLKKDDGGQPQISVTSKESEKKRPFIMPPLDGLQKDKHAAFGGLFWAEQVKYLSEVRLPFRLVFDRIIPGIYSSENDRIFQKALIINNNECFKLACVPTSISINVSNSNSKDLYLLEASDGKFLDVSVEADMFSGLTDETFTYTCEPKSSCIFEIVPDELNGRVTIKLNENNRYFRASTSKQMEQKLKMIYFFSPFVSRFLLEPMGGKSAQQEWNDVFGGSIGLKKIGQLLDNQFPFFLLAQQENFRFYVNVQEVREEEYGRKLQYYTKKFTLIQGNSMDGTNCLLQQHVDENYPGCFKPHLCVEDYRTCGPCLTISSFDSAKETPAQKYLFDFVPRSDNTFAIRSHYNGKFVRCNADVRLLHDIIYKYEKRYPSTFPVDASLETATEFVLSPGPLGYGNF